MKKANALNADTKNVFAVLEIEVTTHSGKVTLVECPKAYLWEIIAKPSVKRTNVLDWDLEATLDDEESRGVVREKRGIKINS
jgi:hypothetical protein